MVTINNPHARESEVIISRKESKKEIEHKVRIEKLTNRKTSAKNLIGRIKGDYAIAKAENNKEMEIYLRELIDFHEQCKKSNQGEPIKIEIMDGWKGKSNLELYEGFENNIIIISHQKDKETGDVSEVQKEIPKENVNRMLFLIKKWNINESHSCYEVANMMGYDWKSQVWKERNNIYFPLYYFPLKTLEALKLIKYSGRGRVTRIR